jgi:hypothetical protein
MVPPARTPEAFALPAKFSGIKRKTQGVGADGQGLVEVEDDVASCIKLDRAGAIQL